jgi:hypothetical protein
MIKDTCSCQKLTESMSKVSLSQPADSNKCHHSEDNELMDVDAACSNRLYKIKDENGHDGIA